MAAAAAASAVPRVINKRVCSDRLRMFLLFCFGTYFLCIKFMVSFWIDSAEEKKR